MIPYKLSLRNFLSYKEVQEPLDFSGMHLACLIGANGHGKSALLDSITWALWGKARAISDDDLMHTGKNEMEVVFEFGLGGQRYHVIRKRHAQGRTKKTLLEVAVWDESTQTWQPLTESTVRATQERINRILRMDYETFTHSAFLRQGKADAFTSISPGRRKEILASILNLSEYDLYAERAKELAKKAEVEVGVLKQRLDELEDELKQRPVLEERRQTLLQTETQARLQKSEAEKAVLEVRTQVLTLKSKVDLRDELERRLREMRRALAETEQELADIQRRQQAQAVLLAERAAIESGYVLLQQAREEETRWAGIWRKYRPFETEKQRLERELLAAKAKVERDLALVRKERDDAQTRAQAAIPLQEKAQEVQAALEQLAILRTQQQEKREQLATSKAELQALQQEKKQVTEEGQRLKERLQVLLTEEASMCPVCKQPLGEDGRQHLQDEYEQQLQNLRRQLQNLLQQEKELKRRQQTLEAELRQQEKKLHQQEVLQKQLAQIEARLQESDAAAAMLPELEEKVAYLQAQLAGDYAPELQAQLKVVLRQMETLAYDSLAHEQARATLAELRPVEKRHAMLQEALQQQTILEESWQRLQQRAVHQKQLLQEDEQKKEALSRELAVLPKLQHRLQEKKQEAEAAHHRWEETRDRLISVEQQLQTLTDLEARRKELSQRLGKEKALAARYRQLQQAFGPRGIQAMIIENALPELETEANRLLRRLSDGRMNVRLETQRLLKSGGYRETLDIIISDELGSRPYELYSGGEAFRVDLALRIALSRLLARRAGAALQTLFIDEGFGTQDAHGRENLVDALHMIKDEFALVLVITHIDELKDQFPVRIQVQKDENIGSYYQVS
ncbi:MAG: SMC family ATPase [Chloroflexi bacterium]|nr:SMC family ATPase [Chloroflexota bacterium]